MIVILLRLVSKKREQDEIGIRILNFLQISHHICVQSPTWATVCRDGDIEEAFTLFNNLLVILGLCIKCLTCVPKGLVTNSGPNNRLPILGQSHHLDGFDDLMVLLVPFELLSPEANGSSTRHLVFWEWTKENRLFSLLWQWWGKKFVVSTKNEDKRGIKHSVFVSHVHIFLISFLPLRFYSLPPSFTTGLNLNCLLHNKEPHEIWSTEEKKARDVMGVPISQRKNSKSWQFKTKNSAKVTEQQGFKGVQFREKKEDKKKGDGPSNHPEKFIILLTWNSWSQALHGSNWCWKNLELSLNSYRLGLDTTAKKDNSVFQKSSKYLPSGEMGYNFLGLGCSMHHRVRVK